MIYWEEIEEFEHDGFEIVFSVTPEDLPPDDLMEFENDQERNDFFRKIDQGALLWFVAKIEAKKAEIVLGVDCLGFCCYESIQEFKKCGYFQEMINSAISEAKNKIQELTV